MTDQPTRILLTNDDGVRAPGLRAAYEALTEIAEVTVVAPATQQSGVSHMITLETPLRAKPLTEYPGFVVEYTPVDCVKLALRHLLDEPPDLVVSGINQGPNAGYLAQYSGTVAAATEAAMMGFRSLAVSLCSLRSGDFAAAAAVTKKVVSHYLKQPLAQNVVLNVNVPRGPLDQIKGIRWCRQSRMQLKDDYLKRDDPLARPYYWLTAAGPLNGLEPNDDLSSLQEGYVTLTPLSLDWTHEGTFQDPPAGFSELL